MPPGIRLPSATLNCTGYLAATSLFCKIRPERNTSGALLPVSTNTLTGCRDFGPIRLMEYRTSQLRISSLGEPDQPCMGLTASSLKSFHILAGSHLTGCATLSRLKDNVFSVLHEIAGISMQGAARMGGCTAREPMPITRDPGCIPKPRLAPWRLYSWGCTPSSASSTDSSPSCSEI